ncbi:MAG: hypothetical protein KDI69_00870 [Xanthomonadales bacterium]|nr:hypothetical protein [Xanthomonadales bacterium]
MQLRLSAIAPAAQTLVGLFKPLDPNVQVTLDAKRGVLEVLSSTITVDKIVQVLGQAGFPAEPLEKLVHVSGGSTCCGGCAY